MVHKNLHILLYFSVFSHRPDTMCWHPVECPPGRLIAASIGWRTGDAQITWRSGRADQRRKAIPVFTLTYRFIDDVENRARGSVLNGGCDSGCHIRDMNWRKEI